MYTHIKLNVFCTTHITFARMTSEFIAQSQLRVSEVRKKYLEMDRQREDLEIVERIRYKHRAHIKSLVQKSSNIGRCNFRYHIPSNEFQGRDYKEILDKWFTDPESDLYGLKYTIVQDRTEHICLAISFYSPDMVKYDQELE